MAGTTEPTSWFDFPYMSNANHALTELVDKSWLGGKPVTDFHHVWMGLIVLALLIYFGFSFQKGFARSDREVAVPDPKFNM